MTCRTLGRVCLGWQQYSRWYEVRETASKSEVDPVCIPSITSHYIWSKHFAFCLADPLVWCFRRRNVDSNQVSLLVESGE